MREAAQEAFATAVEWLAGSLAAYGLHAGWLAMFGHIASTARSSEGVDVNPAEERLDLIQSFIHKAALT
jgi:hypothetical protein